MINPLDVLLDVPEDRRGDLRFSWATVTGVSPLKIRLDHETQPLIASPSTVAAVAVNDRVYVVAWGGRVVVLGRRAGQGSAYASWTPVMTASGTSPNWGNSARVGRFIHRADGGVDFTAKFTIGSTFTPGDGAYSMALPVPANVAGGLEWGVNFYAVSPTVLGGNGEGIGYGKIEDADLINRSYLRRNDSTAGSLLRLGSDNGWAAGDRFVMTGSYEGMG